MVCRFYLSADGFVLSKPGYNAQDPNLPDVNKLLDSDWFFGGVIIASGIWTVPSGTRSFSIPFTPMPYVPAAEVSAIIDGGEGQSTKGYYPIGGNSSRIFNDRIDVRAVDNYPFSTQFLYTVYGFSQS